MESFYGGLRGLSFNLVRSYSSKSEMLIDFLSSSCSVGYGEYVIINSVTSENGDIYKRTTNLSVDNGAVYITKISGSIGQSASLEFATNYDSIGGTPSRLNLLNGGLIPGYYAENSEDYFNDDICFKTLKTTIDNNTETKIAFQFPYPVINLEAATISNLNEAVIERIDDGTHPFYYSYLLKLPETIKQNQIYNIEKITVAQTDIIYDNPQDKNDITENYLNKDIFIYKLKETSIANIIEINNYYLCDYDFIQNISYNRLLDKIEITYNNTTVEIPLTQAKQIASIALNNDGLLLVNYENDEHNPHIVNQDTPLKWIEGMTLNSNGLLSVSYNNERNPRVINQDTPLKWIENMSLADNGLLSVNYNDESNPYVVNQNTPLKWIKSMTLSNNGLLSVDYNNESNPKIINQNTPLKWIENMSLADNGLLSVNYNNERNPKIINQNTPLKWIDNIIYNENTQRINFIYNTTEVISLPFAIPEIEEDYITNVTLNEQKNKLLVYKKSSLIPQEVDLYLLKQISDIVVQADGTIVYTYTDGSSPTTSPFNIKWITNIEFDEPNNQFVITYNTKTQDPNKNDSDTYTWQLKTIVSAQKQGKNLVINYNTGSPTVIEDVFLIEQLTNFTFNSTTGALTVQTGDDPVEDIRTLGTISYVDQLSYNSNTGELSYSYQNEVIKGQHSAGTIKMLKELGVNAKNQIVAQYNTEDHPVVIGEANANFILDIELTRELSGVADIVGYLTENYPQGYHPDGEPEIPNACVAIGPKKNRTLYAFGYHGITENGQERISENKEWYPLCKLSTPSNIAIGRTSDEQAVQDLPLGGIWFVLED